MFSPRGSPWWRSICGGLKGHTQVLGWTPYGGELALFVLGLCPRLPADPHAEEKLERPLLSDLQWLPSAEASAQAL